MEPNTRKIVFLDASTMGEVSFAPLQRLGEFTAYAGSTHEEAVARVADADVIITNKVVVDKEVIDAAPHLSLICEAATGVNNIDVAYAQSKGIPVRNVPGYSTESVVQATFMHILALAGCGRYYDDCIKNGSYSTGGIFTDPSRNWCELSGKTIGIIGMGAIGSRVAAVASAFGMKVCYFSTSGTGHCKDYPCVELGELLATADVVSVHAPLNERTNHLLGAEQFSKMKKSAILVNMGRGPIVDEAALAAALEAGEIAGAGLDVFTVEPLPADHPLLRLSCPERLHLSPHIAWASVEARERLLAAIVANIEMK